MKLLVHIGAGKTGSSSIQSALDNASAVLSEHNMKYLGIMLENGAGAADHQWQARSGSPLFFEKMDQERAIEGLKKALLVEIEDSRNNGITTLIWSNEWIMERSPRILPALQLLRDDGVDIEIMAYVRRHDRWITSSYIQWGIKYKAYPGPIRGFQKWLKGRVFSYESILKPWAEAFSSELTILNYDTADDVVQHFFSRVGVSIPKSGRANVSPTPDKLAAWSVFNNRFPEPAPETVFKGLLKRFSQANKNSHDVPELETLLPTVEDLAELRAQFSPDRKFVDELLRRSGEPELEAGGPIEAPKGPTSWEMDRLLLEMVFHLQARISALENQVKKGS